MAVTGLDHVQLTIPAGGEDDARRFFIGVLGFEEVEKPEPLKARGGLWLTAGAANLHLGVEADFKPALKAHPAFLVDDLEDTRARLVAAGCPIAEDVPLSGIMRFHTADPFGNRIEIMQRTG